MNILNINSTQSLRIVLGETQSNPVVVSITYADRTATALTPFGVVIANSNGVTNTQILAAPASGTIRMVRDIVVYNGDNVTHNITLFVRVSSTDTGLFTFQLSAGASWSSADLAALDGNLFVRHSLATATNDFLVGNTGGGSWIKKTLAEVITILNALTFSLFTAANDFVVGTGNGTGAKKTLAETKTILGLDGAQNAQTDSYTTSDSDNGKVIAMNKSTANTLTIHQAAPVGFSILVIQLGAGQTTIAAGGSGAILNRQSQTKLAGQKAGASVYVVSNAGTAPQCYLFGDTVA